MLRIHKVSVFQIITIILVVSLFVTYPPYASATSSSKSITNPAMASGSDYTDNYALARKLDAIFAGQVGFYTRKVVDEKYSASAPIGDTTTVNTTKYVYVKNTGKWASGSTCYIYAIAVYNQLFGDAPFSYADDSESYSTRIKNYTKLSGKQLYEQFKDYGVTTGAFIRTSKNETRHSMILLSYDKDNITYIAGNDDGNGLIRICTKSWNDFANCSKNRYIEDVYQPNTEHYRNSLLTEFTVTLAKKTNAYEEPISDGDTLRKIAKGTKLTIVDYCVNRRMMVWYQTDAGDWICSDCCVETSDKPKISVSSVQTVPADQTVGEEVNLSGTISTNKGNLLTVRATIDNSSGQTIQTSKQDIYSATYEIGNDINNDLNFWKLPEGTYTYKVTAAAMNGSQATTSTVIQKTFTVKNASSSSTALEPMQNPPALSVNGSQESSTSTTQKASTLSVSGASYPSGHYDSLRNYGLRGKFTSNYNITSIYATVTNSGGTVVMSYSTAPQSKSYNIRYDGLNNSFSFGTLADGNYTYYVIATDSSGKTCSIESSFDIGSTAVVSVPETVATPTPTATAAPVQIPVVEADPIPTVEPTPVPTVAPTPVPTVAPTPAPSTLSVSGASYPSGHYDSLRNFGLRGVFTSNYDITSIYATVTDSNGYTVMNYSASPWATSYDIRYDGLNNSFSFGSLGNGSYTYSVTATDSSGNTCSISSSFDIGSTTQSVSSGTSYEYPLNEINAWMKVNVGKGSTLRFCSDVSTADQYEIGSISNGASVYVYGTTVQQYESRTWAKINYNGQDGWVNYKWLA